MNISGNRRNRIEKTAYEEFYNLYVPSNTIKVIE